MKEPATPDATETPITVPELTFFFALPSFDADGVVMPLGVVGVLSMLTVAGSAPAPVDVVWKVIVGSPVDEVDVVVVGNFDVDEASLVCEVRSEVVLALVVVASAVVVVELGGSNVIAVIVACVSDIAPDTGSQT